MKWYVKLALFFCREKHLLSSDGYYCTRYKVLFGKHYIFDISLIPPNHVNCKCNVLRRIK